MKKLWKVFEKIWNFEKECEEIAITKIVSCYDELINIQKVKEEFQGNADLIFTYFYKFSRK